VEVVRLEVDELRTFAAIRPIQDATLQKPSLVVEVAVFQEDPESRPQKLTEGAVLRSGDGYRLYFESHQTCYVYVFQIDAAGKLFSLYPDPTYGTHGHLVQARTGHWVPGPDRWFTLDTTRGEEVIYILATKERREDIEDLMRRYTSTHRGGTQSSRRQVLEDVMKKMGVDKVRPGKTVEVPSDQRRPDTVTMDQLSREGVSLAFRFAFRHE
jgi:hypothetical protein